MTFTSEGFQVRSSLLRRWENITVADVYDKYEYADRGDTTESFAEDNAQYDQHEISLSKAAAFGVGFILLGGDDIRIPQWGSESAKVVCKYAVSYRMRGIRPAIRGSQVEDENFGRYPVLVNVYTTKKLISFIKYINVVAVAIGWYCAVWSAEGFVWRNAELPASLRRHLHFSIAFSWFRLQLPSHAEFYLLGIRKKNMILRGNIIRM